MKIVCDPKFYPINKNKIFKSLENAKALIGVYKDKDNSYRVVQDNMNSAEAFYAIEMMRNWVSYEAFHKDSNYSENE